MGQYTATLNLYKRIAHIVNDAEINIFMGYCNYRLNNTGKAIELFKNAIKTNPVLIYPRYSLFKIYVELGNEQKATKIAEESMNIPKKKSNRDTKELITEMEKFLIMNNTDY